MTENAVENQPVCEILDDDGDDEDSDENRFPEKPDFDEELLTRRELIAWYSPASLSPPAEYGIHFDAGRVLKLAETLSVNYGIYNDIPSNTHLVTAILLSFWHEVCHAWIEDLACIAEYITGIDYFSRAVKKYNNYIFMEEALCNTAALGMLEIFFKNRFDIKDKEALFDNVICFMKSQPIGYKNFRRLKNKWVAHDEVFLKNILRLLKRIYMIDHRTAFHAISLFLDPTEYIFPELKKITHENSKRSRMFRRQLSFFSGTNLLFSGVYMESDLYPVHIHGKIITERGKSGSKKKTKNEKK